MKKKSASTSNARIALRGKSWCKRQKEENLTTYCEVVSYSSETHVTDHDIVKSDAEIMKLTEPANKNPTENAMIFWVKDLCCERAYSE